MKNYFLLAFLSLVLLGCSKNTPKEIIVCGDDKVLILDISKSEGKDIHTVWQWKVSEVTDELPIEYQKYLIPLDECKPVDNGNKILLTSSGGGVLLLDKASKKCLFHAHVPMAHSADLLPNNRIAVALSKDNKGNSIELYDISKSEHRLFRDSLYSGHGSVWMDKEKRVYTLGYNEIRAYSLADWESDSPSLKLEKRWETPIIGGHDLVKVEDHKLIMTAHEGVYWFDTEKEEFTPFIPLQNRANIKSINFIPETEFMVYTQAEINWWTHHIYLENPHKVLIINDIDLYKVRIFR